MYDHINFLKTPGREGIFPLSFSFFMIQIQIIEKESQFDNDEDIEFEIEEKPYEILEESQEESFWDHGEKNFVFIDGVIEELPIKILFKYEGEEVLSDVFFSNVGCGFEDGRILETKVKLYITTQKDEIRQAIEGIIKTNLENIDRKIMEADVIYAPDNRMKRRIILNKLRKEEFELVKKIVTNSTNDNRIIIIDGNLSFDISTEEIHKNPLVGIVKNFSWPKEFIKNMEKYKFSEIRSKLIFTEMSNKTKRFSFFLRLKGSSVVRVDFFHENNETEFSNFLANKISGWAQSIGDRAPKNITPIRILEKRLRGIIGNKTLYIRDIRRSLEGFLI